MKLCGLIAKIRHSVTVLRPTYKTHCVAEGLKVRKVSFDCKTRWSSKHQMLHIGIAYRAVLDSLTSNRTLVL